MLYISQAHLYIIMRCGFKSGNCQSARYNVDNSYFPSITFVCHVCTSFYCRDLNYVCSKSSTYVSCTCIVILFVAYILYMSYDTLCRLQHSHPGTITGSLNICSHQSPSDPTLLVHMIGRHETFHSILKNPSPLKAQLISY